MTDDFETEALHYLLGEMDAARRTAFEERLAREPAARTALKECTDALGRFACDAAPAEPLAPFEQRKVLAAIMATTHKSPPAPARRTGQVLAWTRYAWPIAAAILLGLNFVDFRRPVATGSDGQERRSPRAAPQSLASGTASAPAAASPDAPQVGEPAPAESAPIGQGARREDLAAARATAEERQRLDKLRADYASLQRASQALRAEYDSLLGRVTQHAVVTKGLGRLAAMELVDASSYARGERKGLIDLARGILTEPGVVAIDTGTPTSPTVTPQPGDGGVATTGSTGFAPDVKATEKPAPTEQPYAWSVFDETEHRGYLNLYNLPAVTTDRSLQLWVRLPDSNQYLRVGEVPAQFYGGTGSLFYTLPNSIGTPSEILVTQEAKNAVPAAPSGAVVLRGP